MLNVFLWHIVAEEDLKKAVSGVNPEVIDYQTSPMSPPALQALVEIYLELAEKAAFQTEMVGADSPANAMPMGGFAAGVDGYYSGMGGAASGAGKSNVNAIGTIGGAEADALGCLGKNQNMGMPGGGGKAGGDPSPETTPDGGGAGGGGGCTDQGGMPSSKCKSPGQLAQEAGIGYSGTPCYGIDPNKLYSSSGGGVGQPPAHLQHASYSWSTTSVGYKSTAGHGLVKETKTTKFDPDPGYGSGGGLQTAHNPDGNGGQGSTVVTSVQGTTTTTTTTQNVNPDTGKPQGKAKTMTTSTHTSASPQENEKNHTAAGTSAGDAGSKTTASDPPDNNTGTAGGQKYDPNAADSGTCSYNNIAARGGCFSTNKGDASNDCVKILKEQYVGIADVDSSAIGTGCVGNETMGLGMFKIHQLWDPIRLAVQTSQIQNQTMDAKTGKIQEQIRTQMMQLQQKLTPGSNALP